jgi:hypothetical protein
MKLEGIVSKRRDAPYRSGNSTGSRSKVLLRRVLLAVAAKTAAHSAKS